MLDTGYMARLKGAETKGAMILRNNLNPIYDGLGKLRGLDDAIYETVGFLYVSWICFLVARHSVVKVQETLQRVR